MNVNFFFLSMCVWMFDVSCEIKEVIYTPNIETTSNDYYIVLNGHQIQKRQVNTPLSSPPSSQSPHTTNSPSPTTPPTTNVPSTTIPPTTQLPSKTTQPTTQSPSTMTPPTTQLPSKTTQPTTQPTTQSPSTTTPPTTQLPSQTTPPSTQLPSTTTPPTTQLPSQTSLPPTTLSSQTPSPPTQLPGQTSPHSTQQPNEISSTQVSMTTTPITTLKEFTDERYYTKSILHDGLGYYWDELENHTKHDVLSENKHRLASSFDLPFTMLFYGHNITKIWLTTGGFIYMSPFFHKDIVTYSQYVAPLMANFDTTLNKSEILYKIYNDSHMVVEWKNVQVNDQREHGLFTFQAKLFRNGTIMFVYKKIPVDIGKISYESHPLKLGLSDAYYNDYVRNGVTYRSVRRYSTVPVNFTLITDNTVVIFHPQPTCNILTTCKQCITEITAFQCAWCPEVGRCSDGVDWLNQNWKESGCVENAGNTSSICLKTTMATTTPQPTTTPPTTSTSPPTTTWPSKTTMSPTTTLPPTTTPPTTTTSPKTTTSRPSSTTPSTTTTMSSTTSTTPSTTSTTPSTTTTTPPTTTTTPPTSTAKPSTTPYTTSTTRSPNTVSTVTETEKTPYVARQTSKTEGKNQTAIIATVVVLIALCFGGIGIWLLYAYTHPTSTSGVWLIEHRPSQLKSRISNMFKWSTETGEKYRVKNEDMEFDLQESAA